MNINGDKTKELLIGSISKDSPPNLMLCGATVDPVTTLLVVVCQMEGMPSYCSAGSSK